MIRPLWPGDPRGVDWGYTVARWEGSLLALNGDRVLCLVLHAAEEGRGYFRALVRGIERSGYRVAVPVPMADMRAILEHYRFVPHVEGDDGADVWEKRGEEAWPRDRANMTPPLRR